LSRQRIFRHNQLSLGLTDHNVKVGVRDNSGETIVISNPTLLSEVCQNYTQMPFRLGYKYPIDEILDCWLEIFDASSNSIGRIYRNGIFYFMEIDTLKEALGWLILTSLGREVEVDTLYNLNNVIRVLRSKINNGNYLTDEYLLSILNYSCRYKVDLSVARDLFIMVNNKENDKICDK